MVFFCTHPHTYWNARPYACSLVIQLLLLTYFALPQSYVVQTMWIVIMTLAMAGAVYYLIYFDRHVRANSSHRLAALVRASVAISRGNTSIVTGERLVRAVVRRTLSRSRVLIVVTVLFIVSWYPLYILTLIDPKFQQPTKIYKLLTFVAWSNPALNPVVLILFDSNIDALRRIWCCRSGAASSSGSHRNRTETGYTGQRNRQNGGSGGSVNTSPMTSWRANSLPNRKHDGNHHERRAVATTSGSGGRSALSSKKSHRPEIVETSPPPTTGSSATSTPRCLGSATRSVAADASVSGMAAATMTPSTSTSTSQHRPSRSNQDSRVYCRYFYVRFRIISFNDHISSEMFIKNLNSRLKSASSVDCQLHHRSS